MIRLHPSPTAQKQARHFTGRARDASEKATCPQTEYQSQCNFFPWSRALQNARHECGGGQKSWARGARVSLGVTSRHGHDAV